MKNLIILVIVSLCFLLSSNAYSQNKTNTSAKGKYEFGSKTYPGIQPGEIFIFNISKISYPKYNNNGVAVFIFDNLTSLSINFKKITWETKRLGEVAYDAKGNILPDECPVFIKESEFKKAQK